MCEYCIKWGECGCECKKIERKMENDFCYACFHFVNTGKKYWKEHHSKEEEEYD